MNQPRLCDILLFRLLSSRLFFYPSCCVKSILFFFSFHVHNAYISSQCVYACSPRFNGVDVIASTSLCFISFQLSTVLYYEPEYEVAVLTLLRWVLTNALSLIQSITDRNSK